MCLITDQKKALIAEEDIPVFKLLQKDRWAPFNPVFFYEKDKLYKTRIKQTTDTTCFDLRSARWLDKHCPGWRKDILPEGFRSFGPGFHAALKKSRLRDNCGWNRAIFKATIPKGSRYYVDATGLVVSNRIIVH